MRRVIVLILASALAACGGGSPQQDPAPASGGETAQAEPGAGGEATGGDSARAGEFQLRDSSTAALAHGEHPSEIEATRTHAAMRLFVEDGEATPIPGIVIKLVAPDGTAFYTRETDSQGYAEVLVPVNQRYQIEYLSLGRRNTSASVQVPAGPNQDIRLTMRYRRWRRPPQAEVPDRVSDPEPQGFVLDGVLFDSGRATLQEASFERLDRVVEYLTHHPSTRIRVAGHTDNVGNPARNQALSEQRAEAVRAYLISRGVDGARVEAVGLGDTDPVASNDTEEGRAQNRRIEATEL